MPDENLDPSLDLGADETISMVYFEKAEMQYVLALERGVIDPVVELSTLGPQDLSVREDGTRRWKIDIVVWPRADLITALEKSSQGAAGELEKADPATTMTLLITSKRGARFINRPRPV